MTIKLDKRLSLCAEIVTQGGFVLDVGTDHAYLPCFLVESGKCPRAAASDIADGPVSAARRTVERCGLEEKISVYKSDGLLDLPDTVICEATDIVIAGMGGELIAKILSGRKLSEKTNLILQPNTRAAVLRRFLCASGYEILSEKAAIDGKFIYTVINARFTARPRELSDFECAVGRLDPSEAASREYLEKEAATLRAASEGMARSSVDEQRSEAKRMRSLAGRISDYIGQSSAPR